MSALIEQIENEARVSHIVVAEQTDNDVVSIRKMIDKYISEFKEFGQLSFKMTKTTNTDLGNGRPSKTYYLNEQQATFLMTLLRNSEVVVRFKMILVKAFYELKNKEEITPKFESYNYSKIDISNPDIRKIYFEVFEGKCFYSGALLNENLFHIDHIHPKSLGGQDIVMNLVLCEPTVNTSKLNAYDKDFIEINQRKVIDLYASKILAKIYELNKVQVTDKDIPSLLNARTIDKIEELFGKDITRKYYASVLGINWEDCNRLISNKKEHIKEFISSCVIKDSKAITSNEEIYKCFVDFCEDNKYEKMSYLQFIPNLSKELGLSSYQKRVNNERIRVFNITLQGA